MNGYTQNEMAGEQASASEQDQSSGSEGFLGGMTMNTELISALFIAGMNIFRKR